MKFVERRKVTHLFWNNGEIVDGKLKCLKRRKITKFFRNIKLVEAMKDYLAPSE